MRNNLMGVDLAEPVRVCMRSKGRPSWFLPWVVTTTRQNICRVEIGRAHV